VSHPILVKQNKIARKELLIARRLFESKLAKDIKADSKRFYVYVHSMTTSKDEPSLLKDAHGREVTST
jgi:hypothetical protein